MRAWEALFPGAYRTDLDYLNFFAPSTVRNSKSAVSGTNLQSQFPNLDIEDLTAIHHYTDEFYADLNWALRNPASMDDHFRGFNKALNNGVDKLPNHIGTTYRGATIPESVVMSKYKAAFDNGQGNVVEEAFTSTSTNPNIADSFSNDNLNPGDVKVFFTLNGTTGKDVDLISKYGPTFTNSAYSESEILFKSGTNFRVTDFQDVTNNGERIIFVTLTE